MNNFKVKLFDELVIDEYELSKIIKNYIFPRSHYEGQLKKLGLSIPLDNIDFKNKIIKNESKISFRTKNIIFVGYSNKEHNKYYFLQLTTKEREYKQALYFKHIKGHKVYINTNKIFNFNFDTQKVWLSKFNKDKSKIIQKSNWKANFLDAMPRKILKSLANKTKLEIYKIKIEEYKMLDSLEFDI